MVTVKTGLTDWSIKEPSSRQQRPDEGKEQRKREAVGFAQDPGSWKDGRTKQLRLIKASSLNTSGTPASSP